MDATTTIHWPAAPGESRSTPPPTTGFGRNFGSVLRWGRTQQAARWLEGPGLEPLPALWPLREQAPLPPLADDHQFSLDLPRQSVTYLEAGREVTFQLLPGLGPRLDLESIDAWHRADGTTSPVTDEEKIELARRTLAYFRRHLGIRLALV